jgi:Tfp pilus assembly protein PilO
MAMTKVNISLEENTKTLVIGIAIMLAALIISYAIIKGGIARIEKLQRTIIEQKEKLILRKDLTRITAIKNNYNEYLYKNIDTAKLRDSISLLAKGTGVNILSIQPESIEKKGSITRIPFKVNLRSTYNQLGKFLERMEALPALTVIAEIILNTPGQSSYRDTIRGGSADGFIGKDTVADVSLVICAYSV